MLLKTIISTLCVLAVAQLLHTVCYDSWAAWWYEPQTAAGVRVLVTGASRGVGEGVALQYCRLGAHVCMHARKRDSLVKTMEKCKSLGASGAQIVTGDMSQLGAAAAVVDAAATSMGGLDIVIVNHISPFVFETQYSLIQRIKSRDLQRDMQVDLYSYAEAAAAAVPHLERGGEGGGRGGSLLLMTSLAGQMPMAYCYGYCYAKRALAAHAISLRQELALNGSGVHVGLAHLGAIDTLSARNTLPALIKEDLIYASVESTARGVTAMPAGRIDELVIPGVLRISTVMNGLAPKFMQDRLRSVFVAKT